MRKRADHDPEMSYLSQPPKRWTFEQPKLKQWVEDWCNGYTLNLFAGKTLLDVDEFRVDIDPEMPADLHMDAFEFLTGYRHLLCGAWNFGTVLLDPPYNERKAREKYKGHWIGKLTKVKNELAEHTRLDDRVITLGYDTVGMSRSRGFEKIAVCVVCHGGDHNDTLVLVEEKI